MNSAQMTARPKFLFDTDFGGAGPAKLTIALTEHTAELAQVEQTAYRNGYAAAEAKAQADSKQELATALTRIAAGIDQLRGGFSAIETRLECEAVDVAVAAARKLASALIAREPFAEIGALIDDCFRHLVGAPHLVVRVNDALYAEAQETLARIAGERGFDGRLVVLAEPDIAIGDCRIEWADGGITRDHAATDAAIAELVERYLKARRSDAAAPPDSLTDKGVTNP